MNRLKPTSLLYLRPFISSLAINSILLSVALLFNHMYFGTNDDRDISNLLANVSGQNNGHYISFLNIVFAKAVSYLYTWTNNSTNWYVLLSIIFSFLALICICELVIRRTSDYWVGLCLAVILSTWIYKSHYIVFQFTQNAALYAQTGMLLLLDAVLHKWEKISAFSCFLGVLFFVLGGLVRFQSLYFTAPYLCLIVGYEALFHEDKSRLFTWLRNRWKPLAAIALSVILILAARFTHLYLYHFIPELNEYYSTNNLRAELLDYGLPDYEQNADKYAALGLTEQDLWLFSKHTCIDRDVYNRHALETMVAMKESRGTDYSVRNLTLSAIPKTISCIISDGRYLFLFGICGAGFLFFLACTSRRRFLLVLSFLALPLGMMWYFVSVDRMPYRIWYSIVVPALVMLHYFCAISYHPPSENARKLTRFIHVMGLSLLVLVSVATTANCVRRTIEDDAGQITDSYEKILNFAEEHSDVLVLLDRPTVTPLTYASTISPLTCLERGSHANICYQGGWLCWTPGNLCVLQNFDTDNPYRSIGEGMEAYLIDSVSPDQKLAFIKRHYNERVAMEQVGVVEGTEIGIYRFFIP